jgi:peptidyl-prolyl cis-trans isomerase D
MSVIQSIRDKYARWAVIAIAVSLLGFILMDAFAGRTGLFSNSRSTTIGKINGESIEETDFAKKVNEQEAYYQSQGMEVTEDRRQQLISDVWEQQVNDVVMGKEYNELGLTVGDRELKDILYGANPPENLKKGFTDPKTGIFNAVAAQQRINQIKKSGTPQEKQQIQQFEEALKSQRLMSKYMALLANTIYYPKWFLEKRNADNGFLAKASYVTIPYASISDSTVKITDSEIEDYIKDHKKDFEQKDETHSFSYISFSAAPSVSDSQATKKQVGDLKGQFAAATDPAAFIARQGGSTEFFDGYVPKSKIQVPAKDSIFALSKGQVFGPYLDANTYALAKLIDVKTMPDSAKARHILIQTNDPQSGQTLMDDSMAKKLIDSIKVAIDKGARFDSLAKKYSNDKGSAEKGGLLATPQTDYFPQGQMVKAFNDFVFNGKTGDRQIVKTEFGYHLVEILDQKSPEPQYKIAYFTKQIIASQETDNQANNQATQFAGDSRDLKSFNSNFEKNLRPKGYNKLIASDIKPMDFSINGIQGSARSFIKDIFNANSGDVIGPERVGDNYIVAVVTEVNKPGLESVNKARPTIEPILKNRKKGEIIKKNIGQFSTLEQVASKSNQQIQSLDSLRFSGGSNQLGYEPKIIGAVFNPSNKGKVVPELITGTQGAYALRVDNVTTTPVDASNVEQQRKMMEMQDRQTMQYRSPVDVLKKTASIKDYRSKFY